jgi:hypothetical protein
VRTRRKSPRTLSIRRGCAFPRTSMMFSKAVAQSEATPSGALLVAWSK